ncbi:MAG: nucleoside triphosphate pyrophosphohydrolase [Clostridia bacterium]
MTTLETQKQFLKDKKSYNFDDLLLIVQILRSPNGCPWDKVQTHQSLRANCIEEAYELVDAINKNDSSSIKEELGDLLLQCALHSQIASENNEFNFNDVCATLCNKLISRHSHVFGQDCADSESSALDVWNKNKLIEHSYSTYAQHLKQVPLTTPSLMRAYKVQSRASKVGLDFSNVNQAISKVKEELAEVIDADTLQREEELGDLLFAVVNVFRFFKTDPEVALGKAIDKFINRFSYIEQTLAGNDKSFAQVSAEELDVLWNEAKHK